MHQNAIEYGKLSLLLSNGIQVTCLSAKRDLRRVLAVTQWDQGNLSVCQRGPSTTVEWSPSELPSFHSSIWAFYHPLHFWWRIRVRGTESPSTRTMMQLHGIISEAVPK